MTQEQLYNQQDVFYILILSSIIYALLIIYKEYISYIRKREEFNRVEFQHVPHIYFWGDNSWEHNTVKYQIERWCNRKWLNCGNNIQIIDGYNQEFTHISTRHNLYEVKNINHNYIVVYDIEI